MHLGLLFYSDTIAMALDTSGIKGRAVANHGFVEALIAQAPAHHITIILSSVVEIDLLRHFFGDLLESERISLVCFSELKNHLKTRPLDVLHVLGPDLYRGFALRQAFDLHCPVTGITHSLGHAPFLEWLESNLRLKPTARDRLICTTPTAQEAVMKMAEILGGSTVLKTEVIPLGVHSPPTSQDTSLRGKLKIPAESLILLYLGRFSYYTKVDLLPLLLAFRSLTQITSAPVHLVLAGATGGEDYEKILQTAATEWGVKDLVRFVFNPSETDKQALFDDADIFLAPGDNVQETFGLSVVEAMAHGLPVVASDWNGYRALVEDGKTGYLIPTMGLVECSFLSDLTPLLTDAMTHLYLSQAVATRHEVWEEKLKNLVENEKTRLEMGKAARARATAFLWPQVIQKYLALWKNLITLPEEKREEQPLPVLDYLKVFGNYATQTLSDKNRFTLTSTGREIVAGKLPLRLYAAVEDILQIPLLGALLKMAESGVTVEKALRQLTEKHPGDQVRYHLVWLCKYGMVRVE